MTAKKKKSKNETNGETFGTAVTGAGGSTDQRTAAGEESQTLTDRQGHPIYDNQNLRTVGSHGPTTLEN